MRPFRCTTAVYSNARVATDLGVHVDGQQPLLVASPGWLRRNVAETVGGQLSGTLGVAKPIDPHPTFSGLVALERDLPKFDTVIAIGGGSVIDAAKAIVTLRALKGDAKLFHDNLLGLRDLPSSLDTSPIVAVPTTAGSGSEVTPWATVWGDDGEKYSVAHTALYPRSALLDPTLCVSMPTAVTLSTGLDALSHAMEAIWNVNATPASDFIANAAIRCLKDNLPKVSSRPDCVETRRKVQIAALQAGLAMATTRTALAHSISYRLTALFGIPHGFASGLTLGEIARFNAVEHLDRVSIIAEAFGCDVNELPDRIHGWMKAMHVPDYLRAYIAAEQSDILADDLIASVRAENNIRKANGPAARGIVKASLHSLLQ